MGQAEFTFDSVGKGPTCTFIPKGPSWMQVFSMLPLMLAWWYLSGVVGHVACLCNNNTYSPHSIGGVAPRTVQKPSQPRHHILLVHLLKQTPLEELHDTLRIIQRGDFRYVYLSSALATAGFVSYIH
jgi:hypothetical protein